MVVFGIVAKFGYDGLAMATLMAGLMLVAMGLARLGGVIKFIPYPMTIGFTSGIALMQLPLLLLGAVPIALLAIGTELLFHRLERALTPRGMRSGSS